MPSIYAHYRFGEQLLPHMPGDVRGAISRNRDLFDAGLQGPDFLFYYKPATKTDVGSLASRIHHMTGREYFTRVCATLSGISGEEELSYLYGLLAHYCLDAACHRLIREQAQDSALLHNRIESEFERYLMAMDGIKKPHCWPRSQYLKLPKDRCGLVARFYEPATASQIREGIGGMRHMISLMTCHNPVHRAAAKAVLLGLGKEKTGLLIPTEPDLTCTGMNAPLLEAFEEALGRYPSLLEQLRDHLNLREELGEAFFSAFG